jgi:asparagine synthase (glutamine-hydrolysing)
MYRVHELLAPRGPDGSGRYRAERISLNHRRLAIIDLSDQASQPMSVHDGRYVMVFNGEIYNYAELRRQLIAKGCRFQSSSDSEVLLFLFAEYGERCVQMLRGMYALAIWDNTDKRLFIARDPFGIKPLYYADDGTSFRFASSIKALAVGGGVPLDEDPAGHVGFYLWGHIPEPFTPFRAIRSFPAGAIAWVGPSGIRITQTQSIAQFIENCPGTHYESTPTGLAIALELEDSVRAHLVSDVPIGVFLSSGLDSTMVAGLARRHLENLTAITLGFTEYRGTNQDEVPLARTIAGHLHLRHEVVQLSQDEFLSGILAFGDAMDAPTVDGVNSYFISRAASQLGVKVALSGLGGDELLGSYPSFRDIPRILRILKHIPRYPRAAARLRQLAVPIVRLLTSPKYASVLEYGQTVADAYLLRRSLFLPWELLSFIPHEFVREGCERLSTQEKLTETINGLTSNHSKISVLESAWYMRNQLLRDTDWASMAHSVEVRVPMVDSRIFGPIVRALSFDNCGKADIARSALPQLPDEVLSNPKTGFAVPVANWSAGEGPKRDRGLRGWAHEVYNLYHQSVRALARRSTEATTRSSRPLMTVVTPSFNQGSFLEEAICSVLDQDFKGIEYIIIDGGSTDNSVEIIKKYERHLAFWVSEQDRGQSEAINKGFRRARGDLAGWLNSDDVLEPNALSLVARAYLRKPSTVLFHGQLKMIDEHGAFLKFTRDADRPITLHRLLNGCDQLSQPGSFYSSSALTKVGYLDETLHLVMDHDLWIRLLRLGSACFIKAPLARYRQHSATKTANLRKSQYDELKTVRRKYGGKLFSCRQAQIAMEYMRAKAS